ncbi:MAG: TIGR00266 family protein [Flavobacteriales bacterium]|nr:TIGR00266 family protein [Flavobacteriales bacterium]
MNSHEIDYNIFGNDLQCVEIELDPNETVIAEAGSMMMMDQSIEMNTILGDGAVENEGIFKKVFAAGKRVLTGESLFMTTYTQNGHAKAKVTFAAPYPGKIIPMDLSALKGKIICQKEAFLCAAKGVSVGIEFQKRLGVGFFGGEGFIMQKLEGDGLAFLHAGGAVVKKTLNHEEVLNVDTGCLVALSSTVDYNIRLQKGIKNTLFGGEGLFIATLSGPGEVWIQSMPFSRLADRIYSRMPKQGGKRTGEGSILGGIGNLLDGDN